MTGKRYFRMKALTIGLMSILIITSLAYSSTGELHILTVSDAEWLIKEYLIRHTPWTEEQIKVKNVNLSNNIFLPPEKTYEVTPAPKSTMIGRTAFSLNINKDGKVTQASQTSIQTSIWISADIEVWVNVVMTSHAMKGRQIIGEDDVYIGKKDLAELPPGYIKDVRDTAGKRLKRFIGANRPLIVDMLEDPPLFRRGDKVFVVAESETLKVTAAGIAAEDGYRGRPVRVINTQSRKEVSGEVIDGGIVRVRW